VDELRARLAVLEAERDRLREAIARFAEALAVSHDPDQLKRALVEAAVEATGASAGMLVDRHGESIVIGDPDDALQRLELPLSAGRYGFGTLFVYSREFGPEERMTAASLAAHAVVALENARLHRIVELQARIDGLTGLANRRQCSDTLSSQIAYADRFVEPLSVVLADLDRFKDVNDRWGHAAGDVVLREFAAVLQSTIREADLAGRWGGEEFVLLLPGTDGEGALLLAERVRRNLEQRPILSPDGSAIRITASFGVAEHSLGTTDTELVAQADRALYEAKHEGRNRVAVGARAR
jgi:diguanylate cyclase (GGDEF)-like protein